MLGLTLANRYRVDRLIGTGGMSAVYEATDTALGRTVAIKLFRLDTAGGTETVRQNGEVSLLAQLNHFALVTLFDASTHLIDGIPRPFIVTEFVGGSDLRRRIQQGPIDPGEVARMGADLCAALHYVHSQGIIHRDIKPANVLLAPSDFPGRGAHAKLADFGIARLFDAAHQTVPGAVIGTAGYLSPEQARGQPVGPASDVYSLGLVLLECLTGQRSYPGTAVESALARLQRQPEVPRWLGEEWRHLLAGMTVREAEHRLPAADAAIRLLGLVPAARGPDDDSTRAIVSPLVDAGVGPADQSVWPAADHASEPASDGPTAVLAPVTSLSPFPPAALTTTAPLPTGSPTPVRHRVKPRRRRWPLVFGGVLVALLSLAAAFFVVPVGDPPPRPPAYPAVEGELGDHLEQLQNSVLP